jgi:hypothetical protein
VGGPYGPYRAGLYFKGFTLAANLPAVQCGLERRHIKALWYLDVEEIETVVGPLYRQSHKGDISKKKEPRRGRKLEKKGESSKEWRAKAEKPLTQE